MFSLWSYVVRADFGPHDSGLWTGSSRFVAAAQDEFPGRAVVTRQINYAKLTPADAIVFVHPTRSFELGSLERWISAGGRAVILDDFGTAEEVYRDYKIERVPLPKKPKQALRSDPVFPIAEPGGAHETVLGIERVVLNHAVGLKHPALSPILKVVGADGEEVMAALAGMIGKGRLLVVGDSSLALNGMMRYPGNEAFVRRLIRYAGSDDLWGSRTGNIYLVFEDFEQDGIYGEEPGMRSALRGMGRSLSDLHRKVLSSGLPDGFLLFAGISCAFLAVVWIVSIAGKRHRVTLPKYARPIPSVVQGGLAGHVSVILAPKTPRMLALLEIKSAFEEGLAEIFSLDRLPGFEWVVGKVEKEALLSPARQEELRNVLSVFSSAETDMLAKRVRRISDDEILAHAKLAFGLLRELREKTK